VLLQKINSMAGEPLVTEIVLRIGDVSTEHASQPVPSTADAGTPQPSAELLREAALHAQGIQDQALREQLATVMAQALAMTPPERSSRPAP